MSRKSSGFGVSTPRVLEFRRPPRDCEVLKDTLSSPSPINGSMYWLKRAGGQVVTLVSPDKSNRTGHGSFSEGDEQDKKETMQCQKWKVREEVDQNSSFIVVLTISVS
eukprot:755316-Hanusia_phi.AAC.2